MDGWGNPAGSGWGVDDAAQVAKKFDTGNDTAPSGANAFDTGDMSAALPPQYGGDTAEPVKSQATDEDDRQKIMAAGWVAPTPYDYSKYSSAPAPTDKETWESNAAVYEWDGEEGDIGPEYPALELQLFGEPDKRENTGIDFST